MNRLVVAELDYHTPGKRGLGRLSTEVPRLGGHCRKSLARLRTDDLEELYRLIQDVIIAGYLVHVLFLEEEPARAVRTDPTEIFHAWLPGVYTQNPYEMNEDLQDAFTACGAFSMMAVKSFFKQHRVVGGGLLRRDKTSLITLFYMVAGYGIRLAEIGEW
jgi:hypothetical protein